MKRPPPTPIELPRSARGVVVFGGSFDPPHLWHIRAAAAGRRQIEAASPRSAGRTWIVFVPAGRSPLKLHGPVAAPEHRAAMLRLAARNLPRAVVWTDEIDRAAAGPSYTVDTLRRLRAALGRETPIHLAIGADQAVNFHRWKSWRTLFKDFTPIVLLRPPVDTREKLMEGLHASGAWSAEQLARWEGRIAPLSPRDYSSTAVRGSLTNAGRGRSIPVSAAVGRYIRRHGLYQGKPG